MSTTRREKLLARIDESPVPPLIMYTVVSAIVLRQMGPPILVLIVPFAVAYACWFAWFRHRPIVPTTTFLRLYILLYVVQILHLIEEWNTGFYNAFPALWGSVWFDDPARFPAWDPVVFITGNLVMDACWEVAIILFARRNAWANYTAWLFLSGMVVNAIGHPLYSVWLATHPSLQLYLQETYGYTWSWYFPGLLTCGLIAIVAGRLIVELRAGYRRPEPARFPELGASLGGIE